MEYPLLMVAPNQELAAQAEQVAMEARKNCQVVVGDLEEGVKLALAAEGQGFEAVISRGGTYLLIKEASSLPVVEINVSAFDVLQSLEQAVSHAQAVGIAGFPNVIYDVASISRLLGIELVEIPVENQLLALSQIKKAIDGGIKVIVGDTISVAIARSLGIQGILIRSGKRAIFEALEEAERLARFRHKAQEENNRLLTTLDLVSEGVVVMDEEGCIRHFSPAAERITGMLAREMAGRRAQEVLPGLIDLKSGRSQGSERLVDLAGVQVFVKNRTVGLNQSSAGVVATFRQISDIQETESKVRQKMFLKGHVAKTALEDIVGKSQILREAISKARKYSRSNSTVLIYGETGVGKEMFAQGIHNASPRRDGPFVAVNCAALPETLLESELFGYVEGSFTDARKGGKPGLFELSHGGTVFLDEIAEMSLTVQAKLLRVLQEKQVVRIGDDKVIPVDIRIIAATNKDLWREVQEQRFREDLYYRVNVLPLYIPPLRERKEDLPLLAEHLLNSIKPSVRVHEKAFVRLASYHWPGNIRELGNFLEQLVVLAEGELITEKLVADTLQQIMVQKQVRKASGGVAPDLEDDLLVQAIIDSGGHLSKAAEKLGISRTTLWRRLRKR
ncbi:MAG: sigma 54-interacting transcriptional regulator [Bacillota bacterium]